MELPARGVVSAKLAVPRLSPAHLSRPALVAVLGERAPVTLVSAPAGYGKTSVVAEYAAAHRDEVAWLSLDASDDEARLWVGVLAAVGGLRPLAAPSAPPGDPAFLGELDAVLRALPHPVTLVLDDLHELDPGTRDAVDHLLRRLPDTVRLILLTRRDPSLSLTRLRLDGRLRELRAEDLAMDADEVGTLLRRLDPPLRRAQVELLVEQTGGWPAGVRLAAQSLAETDDRDGYLADLAGNDRAIADYLVSEILSRLPAATVHLLHAVSVCDQLPSALVVALAETEDAAEILDTLERGSGLVTAYGPGRAQYRVHPLLRSHMQASLRRTRPHAVAGLHRRAAAWFLDQAMPAEALRHLGAAADPGALVALLRGQGAELVEAGYGDAVRTALAALPPTVRDAEPGVLAVGALAHLHRGELAEAERVLGQADEAAAAEGSGRDRDGLAVAHARLDLAHGRMFHPAGGPAAPLAFPADPHLAAEAAIAADRVGEAERLVRAVLDDPRTDEFARARATAVLAAATGLRGGFTEMASLAARAGDLGAATGRWEDTDGDALAVLLTGYADLMRCRPDRTLDGLARAAPFAARMGPAVVLTPFIDALRAAARFDLGEREEGFALMHRARTATVAERARDEQVALVAMLAHGMATRLGHRDEAHAVVSWAAARLGETAETAVLRAAGSAAISRFDAARAQLRTALDGTARAHLPWSVVEARLVECAIALGTGQHVRAERALGTALDTARAVGVLRPLTTAAPTVVGLLRARLGLLGDLDGVAAAALEARDRFAPERVAVPALTEREHAVLALLPTLHPLAEIAVELGVSTNTVKTHVKALYAKLGVASRREAVAAAARLGLSRSPRRPLRRG